MSLSTNMTRLFLPVFIALTATFCAKPVKEKFPADKNATVETRQVLNNLEHIRQQKILFGHTDDLTSGYLWQNEPGRSDVKETAGAYPAVYGWDLGGIESGAPVNKEGIPFSDINRFIKEAHARGGLSVLTWKMDSPLLDGETGDPVAAVLPGGAKHDRFLKNLEAFVAFNETLVDAGGKPIPVVLRLFHENTAPWFWWTRMNTTPDSYKKLWQFAFSYLTETKNQHNLLWLFAPSQINMFQFERWYPGDAYVDLVGISDYSSWESEQAVTGISALLTWLVKTAGDHGKIAVFAETGYAGLPEDQWFTKKLLATLLLERKDAGIAWVMLSRNAPKGTAQGELVHVPYTGHPQAADFAEFRKHPAMAFEGDVNVFGAAEKKN
jgi:mannan endo-1,4-beta-mannosidase